MIRLIRHALALIGLALSSLASAQAADQVDLLLALASDVSETDVRKAGLASGLVDYKVCAINETWSGLKFARRR